MEKQHVDRIRRIQLWLSLCVLMLATLPFASGVEPATGPATRAGDVEAVERWCAIGDSITQGGTYLRMSQLFYATRYPQKRVEVFNCGISGDTVYGVEKRLDKDILVHKPGVATLMLGMNDVSRDLYKPGFTKPGLEAERASKIEKSIEHVRGVVTRLKEAGVRVILLTPSPYDDTMVGASPNHKGVGAALASYGEGIKALGTEMGVAVVDLNGPMTQINQERQKANPSATLVGPDRVHPGEEGHWAMAYLFLKAQRPSKYVSRMDVNAATGQTGEIANCSISQLKAMKASVEFSCLEQALPYPLSGKLRSVVPFDAEMNQQLLRITGLEPGDYELKIDDARIRSYTAAELGEGVNLAIETATPQYQQALAVEQLCAQRFRLYSGHLRVIAWLESGILADLKADASDPAALKAAVDKAVESRKDTPYYGYYKSQAEIYVKQKGHETEDWIEVGRLQNAIYEKNQPVPHRFSIHPVAK